MQAGIGIISGKLRASFSVELAGPLRISTQERFSNTIARIEIAGP